MIGTPVFNQLCKKAVEKWGRQKQLDKVVEEAGELIVEICHFKLNRSTEKAVLTEAAQVYVMLGQLLIMLDYNRCFKKLVRNEMKRISAKVGGPRL